MSRRDPPEVRQQRGSPEPTPGRCGAKLALTDPPRYCTLQPARGNRVEQGGNGRCGRFGHSSHAYATGKDHHAFKHGRYSKEARITSALASAHAIALQSEHLLDLTGDVAWLEVLKTEQLANLEVGASARGWRTARRAWKAFKAAAHVKDRRMQQAAVATLDEVFEAEAGRAMAQEQVERTLERKAKIVRTRQQVMTESEHLIPLARVATLMAGMAFLVREFIIDEEQRREFGRRFAGYIGPRLRAEGGPAVEGPAAASDGDRQQP